MLFDRLIGKQSRSGNTNQTTDNAFIQKRFSIRDLNVMNPKLAALFIGPDNCWPVTDNSVKLHIGCGENVLEGFVNVDFASFDPKVLEWNLLNPWPDSLNDKLEIAFSEDVLEHFFYNEQMYILCSINCALKRNGVFRVLMPDIDRLISYGVDFSYEKSKNDFLVTEMYARSGSDALNVGMRFSGHKWLHNNESIEILAGLCGFKTISTPCAKSTVEVMNNLNLRDENNSFSFAVDLVREKQIKKITVMPDKVYNAEFIEEIQPDLFLYRARNNDPQVKYLFSEELKVADIVLMNFRSANISQFNEHNYAKVYLKLNEDNAIYIDSSLRSAYYLNVLSSVQIQSKIDRNSKIKSLRFDPGECEGDYFTVGPCEVFTLV